MALVGEAKVCCQTRKVLLTAGYPLQRTPGAQTHPVTRDGLACNRAKHTAEMVGGHRQRTGEVELGALGVRREDLARAVGQRMTGTRGHGSSGGDPARIDLLECLGGQYDRSLEKFVRVDATTRCAQQQAMLEVDLGGCR
jgi:hypothetical protein